MLYIMEYFYSDGAMCALAARAECDARLYTQREHFPVDDFEHVYSVQCHSFEDRQTV